MGKRKTLCLFSMKNGDTEQILYLYKYADIGCSPGLTAVRKTSNSTAVGDIQQR